jgi:glycine/D-amino acid oxidase-like deaminating enzyme
VLDAGEHTITADKVILCTNGFENLTILNNTGLDIDFKFHHNVKGTIGYMSGYLEKYNKPPTAISYFGSTPIKGDDDPYFYLTRRSYEYEQGVEHNLICVGGPDLSLDNSKEYLRESEYPEEAQKEIDNFIHTTYDITANKEIDYKFTWHGLMGYTPNRIRLIGTEPKNERLLYNLGCNGVGILPSVFGGKRISQIIAGESLTKSIFDPRS